MGAALAFAPGWRRPHRHALTGHALRLVVFLLIIQHAPRAASAAKKRSSKAGSNSPQAGGGASRQLRPECGADETADFKALFAAAARMTSVEAAAACLERAVQLELLRPEGYHALSRAWYATGNVVGAAGVLRLGTRMLPSSAQLARGLGQLEGELNNAQAALSALRRSVRADPGCAPCLFSLAVAMQDRGDLSRAHELYAAAVRADDRYAEAWNNLGGSRIDPQAHAVPLHARRAPQAPRTAPA
jgi:tetratricopeptide (TPR) repeat protein